MKKITIILLSIIVLLSACSSEDSKDLTKALPKEKSEELIENTKDIIITINDEGLESVDYMMSEGLKESLNQRTIKEIDNKINTNKDFIDFAESSAVIYKHPEKGKNYYIVEQVAKYEGLLFEKDLTFRLVFNLDSEIEAITLR